MGNKIDRLEADLELVEDALGMAANGRAYLQMAANRLAGGDYDADDLLRAVDLSGSAVMRLNRRRHAVAAERERVAAVEAVAAKREQARARRVERRRERVWRNIRVAWGDAGLSQVDLIDLWPSIVREAILVDQQYCPEAWK